MFDFYKVMYEMGYLEKQDIKDATDWKIITSDQYTSITGEKYQ